VCVCVCVSIYRPAAHMLMTCVLETPKEYRTPGGVSPWASKLYKNPIAREKSSFVCVFVNSRISTVLQPRSGGLLRKILFTAYSCSWSPFLDPVPHFVRNLRPYNKRNRPKPEKKWFCRPYPLCQPSVRFLLQASPSSHYLIQTTVW
jgi:hypothetical protein